MTTDLTPLSGALRNEAANTEGDLRKRLRRLADRAEALEDSYYYYAVLVNAASPPEGAR